MHREWPETVARGVDGDKPRGLFDLSVLSPTQLAVASRDQFLAGRVEAPIVLEVGLDYGYHHLAQDRNKVLNSQVRAPYLLHLSRVGVRDVPRVEALLTSLPRPVRAA